VQFKYGKSLAAVRSIGEGLLGLGFTSQTPRAILVENSIDCALVTLAGMWVGVPAAPISPPRSKPPSSRSSPACSLSWRLEQFKSPIARATARRFTQRRALLGFAGDFHARSFGPVIKTGSIRRFFLWRSRAPGRSAGATD
jgi:hypothetical protein